MKEAFSRYDTVEHLHDDQEIAAYLDTCVAEDDGDGELVRVALGNIARARHMSSLARQTGMPRSALYKALSSEGNPEFSTIWKVIRALEIRLCVEPGTDRK